MDAATPQTAADFPALPAAACPLAVLQYTKSVSAYSCLAPPGVGYYGRGLPQGFPAAAAPANSSEPTTVPCPVGWFKSGYNTEECQPCGAGLLTAKEGAAAEDECFLPAGWGSKVNDSGALVANKCVFGTYGVAAPRCGLSPSPCQVSSVVLLGVLGLCGTAAVACNRLAAVADCLAQTYAQDVMGKHHSRAVFLYKTGQHCRKSRRPFCIACKHACSPLQTAPTN
jgi:hypothetical protein